MKAVVYKGPKQVAVENVEDPRIEQPTDALVHITSCALCGSDLHMYEQVRSRAWFSATNPSVLLKRLEQP